MLNFKKNNATKTLATKLYITIINQSRQKDFYIKFGVQDTPDGRFDMILLHSYLLFSRLKLEFKESKIIAQQVFDLMFADMNQNLRELGVGDIGVGHRIKGMVQAFYGRMKIYDHALSGSDPSILEQALTKNLYRKSTPTITQVKKVADYVRKEQKNLLKLPISEILIGNFHFGPPPK